MLNTQEQNMVAAVNNSNPNSLTLILPTPKVISLCQQYRARSDCTSVQSTRLYTVG